MNHLGGLAVGILLLAPGCSDVGPGARESVGDPGDAAGSDGGSPDADPNLPDHEVVSEPCPVGPLPSCGDPIWHSVPSHIVEAADVGLDRFMALDGLFVLGERDTEGGPERAVAMLAGWSQVTGPSSPTSELEVRGFAALPSPAYALLCSTDGCELHTGGLRKPLTKVAGTEVPHDAAGVVKRSETVPCVYGDGVACFEGGRWTTLVPPGGPRFRAAAADGTDLWFVGDAGRVVRVEPATTTEIDVGVTVDLIGVSAFQSVYCAPSLAAYAADGSYVRWSKGEKTRISVCPSPKRGAVWTGAGLDWGGTLYLFERDSTDVTVVDWGKACTRETSHAATAATTVPYCDGNVLRAITETTALLSSSCVIFD